MNNEIKEILDYLDYGVNSLSISKPPFKIEYEDIKKLLDYITNLQEQNQKYKEVINKANKKLNNFIECCKAEKLESGSDYLHHQYWDMFERFNKQIKDILKEVK